MDVQYNIRFAAFPWMTDLDWQDHRQKWLHGDNATVIMEMPNYRFVPWQIVRIASSKIVANITWIVTEISTGASYDIMAMLPVGQTTLKIRGNGTIDWIIYDALQSFISLLPAGTYYATLYDGNQTYYSEIFRLFCGIDTADVEAGIDLGMNSGLVIEHQIGYDDFVQIGDNPGANVTP